MFEELRDRVALVTGAARGIGRATALALVSCGARLILADIDADTAAAVAAEITDAGGVAEPCRLDVADPDQITTVAEQLLARHGRVDILVNNAGVVSRTAAGDLTVGEWDHTLNVNLRGAFLLTRAFLPAMQEKRLGAVVNISSISALTGGVAVGPDYVAGKAGLIGLTRHFARRAAADGVRVNAVCPGIIDTDVHRVLGEDKINALKKLIPMGRTGAAEEVAAVVLFLVSDMASYVSGETITVAGGIIA